MFYRPSLSRKWIFFFCGFIFGSIGSGDSAPDYSRFQVLAKQGNIQAQVKLGVMYAEGKGVPQNYSKAIKWFKKAAIRGDSDAQYSLGYIYFNGQGIDQDLEKSISWFKKAAEQANSSAQNYLGIIFLNGFGVEQNEFEAFNWFKLAAENGNANGQYNVGWMVSNGRVTKTDPGKALKWYLMAAAQGEYRSLNWIHQKAKSGNSEAQFNLGLLYDIGLGVSENDSLAFKWYRKSAEQGNKQAIMRTRDISGGKPDDTLGFDPQVISSVPPLYPKALRFLEIEGWVKCVIIIDEYGDVFHASVLESSHVDFEKPALKAVRKWKFKPATIDGIPVKVRRIQPVNFKLLPKS